MIYRKKFNLLGTNCMAIFIQLVILQDEKKGKAETCGTCYCLL